MFFLFSLLLGLWAQTCIPNPPIISTEIETEVLYNTPEDTPTSNHSMIDRDLELYEEENNEELNNLLRRELDPRNALSMIEAGAKQNALVVVLYNRKYYKATALHFHTKDENPDIVKLLLEHGWNPLIKDSLGKTAFDYGKDNEEIRDIFRDYVIEKHTAKIAKMSAKK